MAIEINSDTILDEIDRPFRMRAGPGAGKTHWLIGHIIHVLRTSMRLKVPARIACISYTNIAAELIKENTSKRLGRPTELIETGTIHSFLYKNVVRPYLHLLRDEAGECLVVHQLVDGHDEHRPSYSKVNEWLSSAGKMTLAQFNWAEVSKYLSQLTWCREDEKWRLQGRGQAPKYLPSSKLQTYKTYYWKAGIIDHDDVLYFAHRLLHENSFLRGFLTARFPYLFVDEFQDTNPIQTEIVRWLAEAGTTVGIIGDPQQSIYGFQNARPADFESFTIDNLVDYEIRGNRRSTDSIIRILNEARPDGLIQNGYRSEQGTPVQVLVGTIEWALKQFNDKPEFGSGAILARTNEGVRTIRKMQTSRFQEDIIATLREIDQDRAWMLEGLAEAFVLQTQRRYNAAMRSLLKVLRHREGRLREPWSNIEVSDMERRGISHFLLNWMSDRQDRLPSAKLIDIYQELREQAGTCLPGLALKNVTSKGKFGKFAETYTFGDLLNSLTPAEEDREVRTIHKAKGDEFTRVLVALEGLKGRLAPLLPLVSVSEEQRLTYVAMSRARDELFIVVPELDDTQEGRLRLVGAEIVQENVKPVTS